MSPTEGQIGGGGGYGLAQWTQGDHGPLDSWNDLVAYAGSLKTATTFRFQVYYIWAELTAASQRPYLPNASDIPVFLSDRNSSIAKATQDFEMTIEGSGEPQMANRVCYAKSVYKSQGTSFQASCASAST